VASRGAIRVERGGVSLVDVGVVAWKMEGKTDL
jgi:hypothetical protein